MTFRSLLGALCAIFISASAHAQPPQLVTEEMMVKSPDPGIEIYVRNKRPSNMTAFRPERTVLFVHGATYPAHAAFDLKLGGESWMDYIAARGYDVYLLDLPGYDKSTRSKEVAEPAETIPRSRAATPRSKTSARWSISSSRAATFRASICSAGRGARS